MALVLNSTLGIGFAWLLRSANENQLRLAGLAMVAILLLAAWRMAKLRGIDLGRGILGWMAPMSSPAQCSPSRNT
jgi:hypothetical protein